MKKIEYQTELHAKLRKQNETLEEERVAQVSIYRGNTDAFIDLTL